MDLHDGLGDDAEQGAREPAGFDSEPAATATDEGPSHPGGSGGSGAYEDTGGDTGTDSGTDPGDFPVGGTMIVEVDGAARELPAERDYTGDGRPDAAAETADGRVIVFADTEDNETGGAGPDGRADEAYVVDKQTGRVVGAAHLDPASGRWVEGMDTDGPTADGSGGSGGSGGSDGSAGEPEPDPGPGSGGPEVVTVEVGGHEIGVAARLDPDGDGEADRGVSDLGGPGGAGPGDPSGTGSSGSSGSSSSGTGSSGSSGSGTMTVDLGGETRELPAERDYTGDGRPDAATETADGRVIVFADTEDNETGGAGPDGRADEAYVVDKRTGRVVGAAHLDPRTGEWVEGVDTHGSPAGPSSTDGEVDR